MKGKLEEMLKTCYEFGCYVSLQQTASELAFSVFTKIYYSGLNYYSLRDSLRDFRECVAALMEGRRFLGFELNGDYIRIANERLRQAEERPALLAI